MPVSSRKLAANRANAQKSTGPRSQESKEKVALNAIKHGLCGRFKVLYGEDQAEYDDLFRRFMEAEKPADDVERELVAKMTRHTWLSERALRFQEGCFLVQPQSTEHAAANMDAVAVRKDLDNYLRYQTCHDRAYARAAAELAKRRNERRKAENGIASQKRAEERHEVAMAIAKTRLERKNPRPAPAKTIAAPATAHSEPGAKRLESQSLQKAATGRSSTAA